MVLTTSDDPSLGCPSAARVHDHIRPPTAFLTLFLEFSNSVHVREGSLHTMPPSGYLTRAQTISAKFLHRSLQFIPNTLCRSEQDICSRHSHQTQIPTLQNR